jgi:hypothetical protein
MTSHPFPPLTPPDETQEPGSRIWAEYHASEGLPPGFWFALGALVVLALGGVWLVWALFMSVTEWGPALIMSAGWSG